MSTPFQKILSPDFCAAAFCRGGVIPVCGDGLPRCRRGGAACTWYLCRDGVPNPRNRDFRVFTGDTLQRGRRARRSGHGQPFPLHTTRNSFLSHLPAHLPAPPFSSSSFIHPSPSTLTPSARSTHGGAFTLQRRYIIGRHCLLFGEAAGQTVKVLICRCIIV